MPEREPGTGPRYRIAFNASCGGYEITEDGEARLLLTDRGRAAVIHDRWRGLLERSAAHADAYLEGVFHGVRYEIGAAGSGQCGKG